MSTIWKVIITVIITAGVVGGGGYYYLNKKASDDQAKLQSQIDTLNKTVASLKSATTTTSPAATPTIAPTASDTSPTVYIHKNLKFSLSLPSGYAGLDSYNCEGTCTSNLTIASKLSDNSFADSNVKLQLNAAEYTLAQMVASYKKDNNDILKESDVIIGGVTGKKYEIGGFSGGYHYLAVSGKYNLSIDQYPSDNVNQKVVDSILSTFKFPQ